MNTYFLKLERNRKLWPKLQELKEKSFSFPKKIFFIKISWRFSLDILRGPIYLLTTHF